MKVPKTSANAEPTAADRGKIARPAAGAIAPHNPHNPRPFGRSRHFVALQLLAKLSLSAFWAYCAAMPVSDSERFRREAEECRQMAARAANPRDGVAWLKLAADWLNLAERSESGARDTG